MRRFGACSCLLGIVGWVAAPSTAAAAEAVASVGIQAQVSSRTALTVSTEHLQFEVVNPEEAATASVDFLAAARTHHGAPVVLSVESPAALTFTGQGDGTCGGVVEAAAPAVAARWIGSGRRAGRLVFALRSPSAGSYTIPVRFVLSAP